MMTEESIRRYRLAEKHIWEHFGAVPKERFLHLDQPKVKVRVLEVGEGEPVLFIHGGPNAGSTWAPIAPQLQGFRCIALDRPGCGLSEAVDYRSIDLKSFAVDVLASVLDGLQIDRTAIVASSFGSALSLWFAEAYPARVTRIVHEGCPPFLEGTRPSLFIRLMMIRPLGRMIAKQTTTESSQEMNFRQLGHGASLGNGKFPPVFTEWGLSMMNDTDTMKNEIGVIHRASTWLGFRSELTQGPDFLKRVPHPTLFLWGEQDPFGSLKVGQRACEALPDARLVAFPDSGHLPWLDDPDTHARMIQDFLAHDAGVPVNVRGQAVYSEEKIS